MVQLHAIQVRLNDQCPEPNSCSDKAGPYRTGRSHRCRHPITDALNRRGRVSGPASRVGRAHLRGRPRGSAPVDVDQSCPLTRVVRIGFAREGSWMRRSGNGADVPQRPQSRWRGGVKASAPAPFLHLRTTTWSPAAPSVGRLLGRECPADLHRPIPIPPQLPPCGRHGRPPVPTVRARRPVRRAPGALHDRRAEVVATKSATAPAAGQRADRGRRRALIPGECGTSRSTWSRATIVADESSRSVRFLTEARGPRAVASRALVTRMPSSEFERACHARSRSRRRASGSERE